MQKKFSDVLLAGPRAVQRAMKGWYREVQAQLREPGYRGRVGLYLKLFFGVTLAGFLLMTAVFGYFALSLPSLTQLEKLESGLITRVVDRNGKQVHEFYIQRRIWVPEDRIPERLKQSVIAIEDRSFREHWGVDLTAYPSALLPAMFGERARGASTLTQQLAKNLFLTPERSVARKLREILLAALIERNYTKKEILEFYFNHVYLGGGAYGFEAAAERYFSRTLDSLTVDQYALLAGLLQRPEAYRPDNHPERALARRNVVLKAMRRSGFLTRDEFRDAISAPLDLRTARAPGTLGPYFMEHTRQLMARRWGDDFVYNQGTTVEVTVDSALQAAADSIVSYRLDGLRARFRQRTANAYGIARLLKIPQDSLMRNWDRYYARFEQEFLRPDLEQGGRRFSRDHRYREVQAGLILIDNANGAVRAMVGGENFDSSKFNRAVQAVRSPGSAFKPFVYAVAIENGASPSDIVHDQPISIADGVGKVWRPRNYDGKFEGRMTMRRALARSKNLPAIEVGMKYGIRNVAALARRLGLQHNVPAVPSLPLGSADVTLLEMVSAYSVFPNNGLRYEPYFVERILDRTGQVIFRHEPRAQQVMSPEAAWILANMMQDVNIRGTAQRVVASGFKHPSGGKTGTTNAFTDAWYIGFTRDYTMGIWVGLDDHTPMGDGYTGSAAALPMWIDLMHKAMDGKEPQDFARPEGVLEIAVCPISGLRAQAYCPAPVMDYYVAGREPAGYCSPGYHYVAAPSVPSGPSRSWPGSGSGSSPSSSGGEPSSSPPPPSPPPSSPPPLPPPSSLPEAPYFRAHDEHRHAF